MVLVQAIREACLKILENEGAERLSTQHIADVAGINIASLYQYFPNKEAILADVFEEQVMQYLEAVKRRFAGLDRLSRTHFDDTLAAIIDMEIEQRLLLYRMDPGFYQAYQQSFDIHRRVNELTISLNNPAWEDWLVQFLSQHLEKLRSPDIQLLARVTNHTLSGTLAKTVADEPELLLEGAFKRELLTMLLNYLRA